MQGRPRGRRWLATVGATVAAAAVMGACGSSGTSASRGSSPAGSAGSSAPVSTLPPPIDATLELVGLSPVAGELPPQLSQGQRKLAGVARALACRPRLLLLDEPAAGLDTAESVKLGERLRAVVDSSVTVVLVEHDMGLVLGTCDRVVVLNFGRVIAEGAPEDVRRTPAVIAAYLGDDLAASTPGAAT